MSAPQWVSGPWVVDHANSHLVAAMDAGSIYNYVAVTEHPYIRLPRDVCDANARLIAAAPIMAEYIIKKAKEGDADATQIITLFS